MQKSPQTPAPADAAQRRNAPPVIVYTVDKLPPYDRAFYDNVRRDPALVSETIVPPRDARTFAVPAGHLFRIVSIERSEEHTSELQSRSDLVCRLLLEKKKK